MYNSCVAFFAIKAPRSWVSNTFYTLRQVAFDVKLRKMITLRDQYYLRNGQYAEFRSGELHVSTFHLSIWSPHSNLYIFFCPSMKEKIHLQYDTPVLYNVQCTMLGPLFVHGPPPWMYVLGVKVTKKLDASNRKKKKIVTSFVFKK
jgi:hypothetical protein